MKSLQQVTKEYSFIDKKEGHNKDFQLATNECSFIVMKRDFNKKRTNVQL